MTDIEKIVEDMINCEINYLAEAFKCNLALSPKTDFKYTDIVEIFQYTLERAGRGKKSN